VHFHRVGSVEGSYIKKCAIHHSFNRAVAIHAVDRLEIINNVAYDIRGMAFFTEDGVERHNIFEDNLGVLTQALFSLLVVDQTPATYWFTNPSSHIRRNVAAGSSNFGFWFRPLAHPDGLSETTKYCPNQSPLGSFVDNVVHTTRMYNFKIQDWTPKKDGYFCNSRTPEQAFFDGFIGYKAGMAGIWASCTTGDECADLSHITFNRFVFLDARNSAWEAWQIGPDTKLTNSLMIGMSSNNATLIKHVKVDVRNDEHADETNIADVTNPNCFWNEETPRVFGCSNNASRMFMGATGTWMRLDLGAPMDISYIEMFNYNGIGANSLLT
jgi:hypothetical protein